MTYHAATPMRTTSATLATTARSRRIALAITPSVGDTDLVLGMRLKHSLGFGKPHVDRRQAGDLWKGNDLVFTNELGEHLTSDQVRRSLLRALKAAELPRIRPHDLRHTHASLLLRLRPQSSPVRGR
jgi:integrase